MPSVQFVCTWKGKKLESSDFTSMRCSDNLDWRDEYCIACVNPAQWAQSATCATCQATKRQPCSNFRANVEAWFLGGGGQHSGKIQGSFGRMSSSLKVNLSCRPPLQWSLFCKNAALPSKVRRGVLVDFCLSSSPPWNKACGVLGCLAEASPRVLLKHRR